ncbi:MAG: protein-glutamate O-methyltransferase CheR [Elusimicrobia bacterium]|nr:protein-glutamate O-methyltransferase CheR [Elusimicrobiota bacterium]
MDVSVTQASSRLPPASAGAPLEAALAALLELRGLDLRDWRPAVLEARLKGAAEAAGCDGVPSLLERARADPALWETIAQTLLRRPAAWFWDPRFFRALRARVTPLLKTYPSVRVWVPGEIGGEEAAAIAIVLDEEGVLDRSRVYATGPVDAGLDAARAGRFDAAALDQAAPDYYRGGGRAGLSSHFAFDLAGATLADRLKRRIVFGQHSLATDGSLNEFHLIVCRRALLDFNARLRQRAFQVFWESLPVLGVLALPAGEPPLPELPFQALDRAAGLFRRSC